MVKNPMDFNQLTINQTLVEYVYVRHCESRQARGNLINRFVGDPSATLGMTF